MEKTNGISRRSFLKGVGGVAATVAILGSLKANAAPIPPSVVFAQGNAVGNVYKNAAYPGWRNNCQKSGCRRSDSHAKKHRPSFAW